MKFRLDHDYHIHSFLSPCSADKEQNPETILEYAEKYNLKDIVITDHFWDGSVPCGEDTWQGIEHISQNLPLPKSDKVRFHFGGECDVDRYSVVGINKDNIDKFDFLIVPLNHMHLKLCDPLQNEPRNNKRYATAYVQRIWNFLQMDYPFYKMGLAHVTFEGLAGINATKDDHLEILSIITDEQWRIIFSQAQKRGLGIEINSPILRYTAEEQKIILKPYQIAIECGCKFYVGTDAHHPSDFENSRKNLSAMIDLLDLKEEQKFNPFV